MSTITLPNIRVSSDLTVKVRLKDGGVAIDWSTLSNVRALIYSDAQRAMAGRCVVTVDAEDATLLVCQYAATKPQYIGVNRIVISATYMNEMKTYDKPALNFVRWTDDQAGQEITISDPDVDVEIEVEDISSSILQEAVDAAFSAAERADEAAAAAEHMVDIHQGPPGPAGKAPYIDETTGNWFVWDDQTEQYVDSGNHAQGPAGNGIASWIVAESQEDGGINVVTVTFTNGTSETFTYKNGSTGATPNLVMGIVETGAPGSRAEAEITGTPANPILHLKIPQGEPGVAAVRYVQVDTLPSASSHTLDALYLVPTNTADVYDVYYTSRDGQTYSWVQLCTTSVQLSDYATKAEVTQLEHEVGNPVKEYKDMGLPTPGTYNLNGAVISELQSGDRSYHFRKAATQGDKYKVCGLGGTTARLWGFIDGDGNVLSAADESVDSRQNPVEITAPVGAVEVVINLVYFSPITDWVEKPQILSLTEQVETKAKRIYYPDGPQILSDGYYNLSSSTLPTTITSSQNYKCIKLEGNPGDMFFIVGASGSSANGRLWATGSSTRERKRYALLNQDARTKNCTITLAPDEKYLYVNLNNPTTGDGVWKVKYTMQKEDLMTRVDELENTTARRGKTKKSFPCMLGALRYTNGSYAASKQYLPGYSHTPKFIKNYGWFKVNYSNQFRILFYDSDQAFIGYDTGEGGPVIYERNDFAFFRVYTTTEEVRSIEIESYWMGDDEVFQKLPADDGYQQMSFGVNINKGFVPNDTGVSAVTTGFVKSFNFGMLHLPASYKESGTPTPLIIYLHGAADRYEITSTRFASGVRYSPEWDSMGFAQMDVDMLPDVYNTGNSTDVQAGTGDDAACVEAAYNWAIQHFNIRRDGVYLFGRSRGGEAVLEILAKLNQMKMPVVCALSNSGANAMLLYSLFRTGNSTFWRIFCESTGLDALNPPAYSSGLIIANSTIANFLRTNIGIWWKKAMVALPMCVDNPTEYQTPTQIFDLLISSYTGANPGKTFIENFIERCKFRSPVPLRFDWCYGDTTQPWEDTSYGNYGSAGKDGFVNNKLTGNAIYRRWPSCPEGGNAHFHEMYNLADYTLPNGETIENASMAMVEWLLWAMGQDERFTI